MASQHINSPLVVIVGPTASGKSGVAISIAKAVGGEIISADSRTLYKYMDIGTAKPTLSEQDGITHWGLDLIEPGVSFSAADFKKYADEKIAEIRQRGHVPILVGGTGLYVDAVVYDYQFGPAADTELRGKLEKLSLEELYVYCNSHNVSLPENDKNKRYVIRAIERHGATAKRRQSPLDNTLIVGITTDKNVLRDRIRERSEQLFDRGVVEEASFLGKKYGWDSEAMKGNIYPIIRRLIDKEITIEHAKDMFVTLDWRLAKRQLTWLRRSNFIVWLPLFDIEKFVLDRINN